ncbi:hypothetical protein NLJ89_g9082 [Agrocybe chaxingu]|uniref:Protein kinase domain-containing protein n=1 Tax=Agrocybe chaxingu TaxID=84603 RepID=A0A9W8K190_9AGAR|nr:hypothetical protein NLJ89_g9082 [Agrocybe chaxingu]
MLPPDDPFRNSLSNFLGLSLHSTVKNAGKSPPSPDSSPLTFFDTHISPNLILKHVVPLSSIPQSLSELCDRMLRDYIQAGHRFKRQGIDINPRAFTCTRTGAHYLEAHYEKEIGYLCCLFLSRMLVHPDLKEWNGVFRSRHQEQDSSDFLQKIWLEVCAGSEPGSLFLQGALTSLDAATQEKLKALMTKYPRLASWYLFAQGPTSDRVFRGMGRRVKTFPWETNRTTGSTSSGSAEKPLDSESGILHTLLPSSSRKATTRKGSANVRKSSIRMDKFVKPNTRPKQESYRALARHYLQHAWAEAVENDSTFLTFNNGGSEYIGIRHRESQTLYLSNIIDTVNIKDPHYRKLQLGLYLAIVQDAFDRLQMPKCTPECNAIAGQKRSRSLDETEMPEAKRLRLTPEATEATEFARALGTRHLAAVHLHYGPYHSPAPSSFIRVGTSCAPGVHPSPVESGFRKKYEARECFSLILGPSLGRGAVGVAHTATAEVLTTSGEPLRRKLVVKIAFTKEQKRRLRHEFRMYSFLAAKSHVQAILPVHGLFRDPDSGALAMVMDYGGQSLRQREQERTKMYRIGQVTTSSEERRAFAAAIVGLHAAGVWHGDLRIDNLLVNPETKQIFIIDFDCAEKIVEDGILKKTSQADPIASEIMCMRDILTKKYGLDGRYY